MKYLFVSGTIYDCGGLAMIKGAINGIMAYDKNAEFASLHEAQHHKNGIIKSFMEPLQNDDAFIWADIILDIGGLCDNQNNKNDWFKLRLKYNKPLIWMAQSFKSINTDWLTNTVAVARGKRSYEFLKSLNKNKCQIEIAPDLSFLIKPKKWNGKKYKRAFSTNLFRDFNQWKNICNKDTDVQIIEKQMTNRTWEELLPIDSFCGTPEENFGLVASVGEVYASRYQIACASILAGIKPNIFMTGDEKYDAKYLDLIDYFGMSSDELINEAIKSCKIVNNFIKN